MITEFSVLNLRESQVNQEAVYPTVLQSYEGQARRGGDKC